MTEKSVIIHYPEYGYKIHLVLTNDIVTSRNKRSKFIGHDLDIADGAPLGLHSYSPKSGVAFVLIQSGTNNIEGTIAHECAHAVFRMANHIGAHLDEGSEEFYTYNIGYLVDNLHKLLASWPKSKARR